MLTVRKKKNNAIPDIKNTQSLLYIITQIKGKIDTSVHFLFLKVRIKLTISVHYSETPEAGLKKDFNFAESLPL